MEKTQIKIHKTDVQIRLERRDLSNPLHHFAHIIYSAVYPDFERYELKHRVVAPMLDDPDYVEYYINNHMVPVLDSLYLDKKMGYSDGVFFN